ncbi:helix-turn-helix transcriptional regulator [Ornithinimicrobium avium]|uniref:helix-turn-helix transcriptional regulator n=1 Tax=Ornithinimicrobium avium TaxID=2283195 RepID=UPI0013B46721|nr:LuxR C-terminal-related transcriptional regulator [Ornithinimicrobium avium]
MVTSVAAPTDPGPFEPHVFGEAYEHFVSRVYVIAIGLGMPSREGLRSAGLEDAAITMATGELVARGLLERTADPDAWDVPPPREAIARNADRMEHRAAMARATASEVEALWRRAVGQRPTLPPVGLQMLQGVEEIVDHVVALHRLASSRVWLVLDASPAAVRLLERVDEVPGLLTVRAGADVRLVLDTELLDSAAALSHIGRSRAEGHQVAVANGIPFTTVVADAAALVDLTAHDGEGEGSFEVRLGPPVRALTRLVEEIWGLATPYAAGLESELTPHERIPLPERDQRILALLTTGASDKVIARQTGVSVRTVERRVRWLMDHLGVATRFQAGVQAARRGWI